MKNTLSPHTVRIVSGSLIILIGIATLLGSIGLYNFGAIFGTWWPILVICGGLLMLASSSEQYVWGLLVILLGILWQLDTLNIIDFNIWQLFWPLIIIAVGWSIIRDHDSSLRTTTSHGDRSDMTVFLGGVDTKSDSKDYQGGKISAVASGGTLDLRQAVIKKEATIDVFALMAGIEIKVPAGWIIRNNVTPILGGVENTADPTSDKDAPVLNIIGSVVMGGIEIKN